ncbi:MAG: hypothetical protein HFH41_12675 [Lachnospiraceae bacterium]|nr:hypothetical protein [Lachnospiraceae bacterium]
MSQGYSQLFQSLSTGGGAGNQNFLSDYASIKSGSYGKLLKAYYGKEQNSASGVGGNKSDSRTTLDKILEEKKNPKISKQAQEANENLTAGLSKLKGSVSALQDEKTYTDTEGQSASDKVVSAMKNYVADYNSVVTAAKRSTLAGKTAYVANMMNSTSANADKLSELGITINANGTLQLNEGKLKETDVKKVQDLFSSKDIMSYGSKISSRVQFANTAAGTSTTDKTDKTDAADDSTGTNNATGSSAASLKADGETLASDKLYEKIKDENGNETGKYDIDKIFAAAKSFVSNYNGMFDTAESSSNSGVLANLSQIKGKTAQSANVLKQFGISVDVKGRMKIDEDIFKKSDMSQVQKFFKDYGSSVATHASLVDFYMTTHANAANGYTAAGAYNVQGSSRYADFI